MNAKEKWLVWIARNPIKIYMRNASIAATDVAGMLFVSRAIVYYWLSGEKIPSQRLLNLLEAKEITTVAAYAAWWAQNPNPPKSKRSRSAIDKERVRKILDEKSEMDPNTGCKIYCGAWRESSQEGVAQIRIGRRIYTIQVAALWVAGKLELYEKVYVYRTCKSRACCNVAHIKVAGNMADGMADMRERGMLDAGPRGIYLTKSRKECVKTLLEDGRTPEHIAADTGVNVYLIRHIKNEMESQAVAS